MTEKFQVGDIVRCIDAPEDQKFGLYLNDVHEVDALHVEAGTISLKGLGHFNPWSEYRFELVLRAASPEVKDTNPKDAIAGTKAPLGLCSPVAMVHWAVAHAVGMTKYGAWNWRIAGVRASVYVFAILRHLLRWVSGEEFDPVDGQHHLGAIMACCAIILDAREAGKLTDDRPPSVNIGPLLEWAETIMVKLQAQYADKEPRHYTIADTQPVKT